MTEHVVAAKGAGEGARVGRFFFLSQQCYIESGFFPLWHLISKPFAPTVLTANVKLTDVLELDPEWDSYKVTTPSHQCLFCTQHSLGVEAEHLAAFLGAVLPSGLVERQGVAPTLSWLSTHCILDAVTWMRFLQTVLPVISKVNCIPPITKVMLLENQLEKQHCLWRSQTRQQMFFFSWDLIRKTDKFKTFAPYGRWSMSHSSHTHMRNCRREQRK